MASPITDFGETAIRLSKNPLGTISLFIVLVYGIAAFVFGSTVDLLTPDERLPLIYFVVGFPVLVLGVFGWLVSRHHTKLYSPKDYRDDTAFLQATRLTRWQIEKAIDSEIRGRLEERKPETVDEMKIIVRDSAVQTFAAYDILQNIPLTQKQGNLLRSLVGPEGLKRAVRKDELREKFDQEDIDKLMQNGMLLEQDDHYTIFHDLIAEWVTKISYPPSIK